MTCKQCTFLQEQGEVSLPTESLDIPLWLQSNGNPTLAKSLENEPPMDGFPDWLCGKETLETLTLPNTPIEWIASMQDSLVRTLASLGNRPELAKEHVRGFTEKSCGLLAQLDHDSFSWKMSPLLKATALSKLSKTWPSWGMTVDGFAYEHQMSGRRITATDGSHWPTPTVHMTKETNAPSEHKRNTPTLTAQVNWPTPRTAGMCGGSGAWALLNKNTTVEEARQMGAGNGGKLNPTWVEWLMGWPLEWTNLKQLEMVKSPSKSRLRSASSAKG